MDRRDLPTTMDKCIRHAGGTKVFFYTYSASGIALVDPADGQIVNVPESHFKNRYQEYSENLPEKVKRLFGTVPDYREWRRRDG